MQSGKTLDCIFLYRFVVELVTHPVLEYDSVMQVKDAYRKTAKNTTK